MDFEELKKIVLECNGFSEFNPMQLKALQNNLLFEKNLVVSAPTASGKTLLAELASLNSIINHGKKVVYTAPLRALASEHFQEFRKKYSKKLNVRVTISTGDFDSSSAYLKNYDIIFCTNEKLDSLQRHDADWLWNIGLLIVDEVHELDSDRGPVIEMVVSKFLHLNSKIKLLALSATIPNSAELAEWLNANLIESNFRPIPLKEGVYFGNKIFYNKKNENAKMEFSKGLNEKELNDVEKEISFDENLEIEKIESKTDDLGSIVFDTFSKKKQALVFANTRKRAEGMAKQLSAFSEKILTEKEKNKLEIESEKILNALELPTEQCKKLSELVKKGSAFHHAGLLNAQRRIVEDLFRENCLKVLSATPTLAMGINAPAHTVIVSSCFRYGIYGMEPLPVREIKQMIGRAGRPKYDSEGRGILIARSDSEVSEWLEHYINGEIEEISSKLGLQPVLRMHLLSLISSNIVFDLKSSEKFFEKTFYSKQFGSLSELFYKTAELLDELKRMNFVEENGEKFHATELGKRVSELYLDPLSAFEIINSLKKSGKFSELSYLFLLNNTSELYPWFGVSKKNEEELWEKIEERKSELQIDLDREMFFDLNLLKKFNSTLAFNEWIDEKKESSILEEFNLQPGILHSRLEICDWLNYSALELAKLLELQRHFVPLAKLRKRLKNGVKEELIHLTELKGIGRVRGRLLYNSGIKSVADVKKTDIVDLARILGKKIAENAKQNLGIGKKLKYGKTGESDGFLEG